MSLVGCVLPDFARRLATHCSRCGGGNYASVGYRLHYRRTLVRPNSGNTSTGRPEGFREIPALNSRFAKRIVAKVLHASSKQVAALGNFKPRSVSLPRGHLQDLIFLYHKTNIQFHKIYIRHI